MTKKRSEADTSQLIIRPRKRKEEVITEREPPLKIRIKEPTREALERRAAERGVSMNVEVNDRLESSFLNSDILNFFFQGNSSLEEVLILRRYLKAIKEATVQAGEHAGRWWVYAPTTPFALDRERVANTWLSGNLDADVFDVEKMAASIRTEIESRILKPAVDVMERDGAPGLPTAYSSREEMMAAADHLYLLRKSCEVLISLRDREDEGKLRREYEPIYKAAAEWEKLKPELAASEQKVYSAVFELAKIEG
ncbi:MAG: hypothetical protein HZA67_02330 [Rhodospirillales bacterium]|nr:hypothetical protein [Rhodospirillales bacterium]